MDYLNRIRVAAGICVKPNKKDTTLAEGSINSFWIVVDPCENSDISDIMWQDTPKKFTQSMMLNGHQSQKRTESNYSNISFHVGEGTAKKDAKARLKMRDDKLKNKVSESKSIDRKNIEDEEVAKFEKGMIVLYKNKEHVIEVPNARGDFVGIIPLNLKNATDEKRSDAVNLVKTNEVSKVEHIKEEKDVDTTAAEDGTVWATMDYDNDKPQHNQAVEDKIDVPKEVLDSLSNKIKELNVLIKNEKVDMKMASHYKTTVAAFDVILSHLSKNTITGLQWAQIDMAKLMNPILSHIPDDVYCYITRGGNPQTLLSLFKEIKAK